MTNVLSYTTPKSVLPRYLCASITVSLAVVTAGFSIYVYAAARDMAESFGLDLVAIAIPAGFSALFGLLVPVLIAVVIAPLIRTTRWRLTAVLLAIWLGSLLLVELPFQLDEIVFRHEAAARDPRMAAGEFYSRDRWWPHGGSTLIYQKGVGFHATD